MTETGETWKVWVDTGGTFTDCLAVGPDGIMRRAKVLSSSALRGRVGEIVDETHVRVEAAWKVQDGFFIGCGFRILDSEVPAISVNGFASHDSILELASPLPENIYSGTAFEIRFSEEAPTLAARMLTGTPAGMPLPPMAMRLATTRGTNALLERRGADVALFITRGFGDLLLIGNQQRPDLFALDIEKPKPLYRDVVEVPERLGADGSVVAELDLSKLDADIDRLLEKGITTAAIALMNGYKNSAHEEKLESYLREKGFQYISRSSELAPLIKILPRAETAVVDAYLSPVIGGYLESVSGAVSSGTLHVMTSAGGLVRAQEYRPKDSLLSGPAGGVVGAALSGKRSGFDRIIAFDMGGTSTDVARFDGDYEYVFEHRVGDANLVAPALAIESVAAGGGSVCAVEHERLRVGPESAGAFPGPACYGAGGPLTITDVNLLLGRLNPEMFEIPIEPAFARKSLEEIVKQVPKQSGERIKMDSVLEGFLQIANERMADAIRRISIRQGYDPSDYALVAFGGAGGQHACAVAELLDIKKIIVPGDAGLLSALGLGHAAVERIAQRQILRPLEEIGKDIDSILSVISTEARDAVLREGIEPDKVKIRRRIINMRYAGQESAIPVEYERETSLAETFSEQYEKLYGYRTDDRKIEVESIRVVASSETSEEVAGEPFDKRFMAESQKSRKAFAGGSWQEVPVFYGNDLTRGALVNGPALVFESYTTTLIEVGWYAEMDRHGALVMESYAEIQDTGFSEFISGKKERNRAGRDRARPEAVQIELFSNRFVAVAREMGEMLRRTALSTNVKERLDFSCAILDADGELVVNAPHIPVHLGALGICVRKLKEKLEIKPGDVLITNHPAYGGTHLPDITVVTPVFADDDSKLLGYVASRAHHAEIGGARPGSMPPDARSLAEEGVVIEPMYLARADETAGQKWFWEDIRNVLSGASYPSRAVEVNIADIKAAVAANHRGAESLRALSEVFYFQWVKHYMAALKEQAERRIRDALSKLPDGTYEAEEELDDGSPLRVRVEIMGDSAKIDFTGSAEVHPGNLNATPAVVRSVVLYALRLLVAEPMPLNEGLMRAVELEIPGGILNPPFPPYPEIAPAIVGGNVETSQKLANMLLKAFRLCACGQGTMNNLLFGNEEFSYYETICGGVGATTSAGGADAVHSHMTNTRITDPEIIEHRYPVRLEKFGIRRGSGGNGKHRGGDGAVREFIFIDKVSLSLLSQSRKEAPCGMEAGGAGATGNQKVIKASGDIIELGGIDGCEIEPGDRFIIETPGGGAWGAEK
ncbi:MAG: hydantoinase B/oxoprolinase family protein [Planctomycetota bacterium]|jgi:5-oxoprolinase (ATP-hydrolysing)